MLERSIQVTYLLDKRGELLTRILSQGGIIPGNLLYMYLTRLSLYFFPPRDQENLYTEKMQNLQQTLVEERDKILQNANQQRSVLEESLHSTKTEEQRLRTKLAEAEEVGLLAWLFSVFPHANQNNNNNNQPFFFFLPDLQ